MTDDLATRIRQHYEAAADPVDADEAINRHNVRVAQWSDQRRPLGWLRRHPVVAAGAAAMATLLLLGGALFLVSTDPDPTLPVAPITAVAGESKCAIESIGEWTGDPLDGGFTTTQRGQTNICTTATGDARVNGEWDVTVNCDYAVENDATVGTCWGTLTMEGGDGGWDGTYVARTEWSAETPVISHIIDADVLGRGSYVGLRYIHRYEGSFYEMALTGQIGPADVLGPPTTADP